MSWSEVHLPRIAKTKFCLKCPMGCQLEPNEGLDDSIRIDTIIIYQSKRR